MAKKEISTDENNQQSQDKNGTKWRDASYKQLFTFPEMVSDLLQLFIPSKLVGDFDPSSLEEESPNHINRVLSERRQDKIWRVKTKNGNTFYLYLLFEFQSYSDKQMALRVTEYSVLFLLDLYHKKIVKSGEKHPPVLPIVIYSGTRSWAATKSCAKLCQDIPLDLVPYQPNQSYYLVDVVRLVKESASDKENLAALLFRMEQCKSIEDLIKEVDIAKIRLRGDHYEEFRILLSEWIRYTVMGNYKDVICDNDNLTVDLDLEEVHSVLSETIAKIRDQDREDGRKDGIKKERSNIISKLLQKGMTPETLSEYLDIPLSEIKLIATSNVKIEDNE